MLEPITKFNGKSPYSNMVQNKDAIHICSPLYQACSKVLSPSLCMNRFLNSVLSQDLLVPEFYGDLQI